MWFWLKSVLVAGKVAGDVANFTDILSEDYIELDMGVPTLGNGMSTLSHRVPSLSYGVPALRAVPAGHNVPPIGCRYIAL